MPNDSTEVLCELDVGEPPKELIKWAKDNINEDPDTRAKTIDDFRNLIYSRGECSPHRTDDAFLLRFLRARHFQVNRAHRLMVNYYNFKETNPTFVENVKLRHLLFIGEDGIISVPPYRDQEGRRTLVYRIGLWDTKKYTVDEIFQATLIVMELAILEQRAQILGGNIIFDLGDLSMSHTWYMTPSVASKMVELMVTSFPIRVHAIHVLNQSWLFDVVFNVFKPFLDERMRARIFFHGDNYESLHAHIHPKHLNERYGGVHQDHNFADWIAFFNSSEYIMGELRSAGYEDDGEGEFPDAVKEAGVSCKLN